MFCTEFPGISEHIFTKSSDKDKDSAVGTSLTTGSKKEDTHSLVSRIYPWRMGGACYI